MFVTGILYLLNLLHLMQWVSNFFPADYMEARNVMGVRDRGGLHHTIDFTPCYESNSGVAENIRKLATNSPGYLWNFWPNPHPANYIPKAEWLGNFHQVLTWAEHGSDWLAQSRSSKETNTLAELDREARILDRYYLLSFQHWKWPVEIQVLPPKDSFMCRKCRKRPQHRAAGLVARFDDPNSVGASEHEDSEREDSPELQGRGAR